MHVHSLSFPYAFRDSDAPEVTTSNSSSRIIALGEELHLQCVYVGVPAPSVFWFHNDVVLMDGIAGVSVSLGGSIISILIRAVEHLSGGIYMCRANNTVGIDQDFYSVSILGMYRVLYVLCTVYLSDKY